MAQIGNEKCKCNDVCDPKDYCKNYDIGRLTEGYTCKTAAADEVNGGCGVKDGLLYKGGNSTVVNSFDSFSESSAK